MRKDYSIQIKKNSESKPIFNHKIKKKDMCIIKECKEDTSDPETKSLESYKESRPKDEYMVVKTQ